MAIDNFQSEPADVFFEVLESSRSSIDDIPDDMDSLTGIPYNPANNIVSMTNATADKQINK